MTDLQVALIGTGDVADLHAAAIRECDGARLRGVWNRSETRGREKAARYGCRLYGSADDLVADPEIDAVFVLTNLETHRHYAELAMRAGKHVLVEKPAAANTEDIAAMKATSSQNGVQCVPVHNYIYEPGLNRTRALIESGQLGRLVSVHVLYNIFHPEEVAKRYPGVIRQIMTHHAYIVLYLAGEPASVTAMKATINDGSVPQENVAMAIVAMQNGALAHLHASFAADDHAGDPWTCQVRVIGTDGATRFSYRDWVENRRAQVHSQTYSAYPASIQGTVRHFLTECVAAGRPPLSSLTDAITAQRIVEACEASIAEQRVITL